MMRFTLPSGLKAGLRIMHSSTVAGRERFTLVRLIITFSSPSDQQPVVTSFEAISTCHPPDPFCRGVGRYVAARKLLKKLARSALSKADRGAVMEKIVPELFGKDNRPRAARLLTQAKRVLRTSPRMSL